jgi:xanthine dehydrogenase YagR molybdenum-binding subunit
MGIGYALFEHRILDRNTGLMVNPNMEFYLMPGPSDMPEIDVTLVDMPERGIVGLGEPPTISTAAAIANAVSNAIGARIRSLPITPENMLAALAPRSEDAVKAFAYVNAANRSDCRLGRADPADRR